MPKGRLSGFTLIELIVTITLVSFLLLIVIPQVGRSQDKHRFRSFLKQTEQLINYAKYAALQYHQAYRITFDFEFSKVIIEKSHINEWYALKGDIGEPLTIPSFLQRNLEQTDDQTDIFSLDIHSDGTFYPITLYLLHKNTPCLLTIDAQQGVVYAPQNT